MTELEKLKAGQEYCYDDPEVEALKERAIILCREYNAIDDTDYEAQSAFLDKMLGAKGKSHHKPDNMRGFDPASEDDMDDNGMSRYMENNDEEGWD